MSGLPRDSLLSGPAHDKKWFPHITTAILEAHTDEVWIVEWSPQGNFLASASRDKSVILWALKSETSATPTREWEKLHVLNHPYPPIALAWSFDSTILLTGSERFIKIWNTETGKCMRTLEEHSEPVTALIWLPDNGGFISVAMDFKIILWSTDGNQRGLWAISPVRIVGMVATPDFTRLVAIGMGASSSAKSGPDGDSVGATVSRDGPSNPTASLLPKDGHHVLVFDFASKRIEKSTMFDGELASLSVSRNSQYVLLGRNPDELQLRNLDLGQLVRKYTGQRQTVNIIRSCFGGDGNNFVLSGSEDAKVYVWDLHTEELLEVLEGHGEGSVNCVVYNPRLSMFASCSDDRSIRVWESVEELATTDASNM